MLSSISITTLYLIFEICKSSYFLSSTPLSHWYSGEYCQNYCNSHLISIHNESQYFEIIEIIKNGYNISHKSYGSVMTALDLDLFYYDIWTGLYRVPMGMVMDLLWTDNTPFNYATKQYEYPWQSNNPDNNNLNEQCVHIWIANEYRWNDLECNTRLRFMCKECVGKMNKYMLITPTSQQFTFSDAQSYCKSTLGTDLASIHSEDDYLETKLLCKFGGGSSGCWIGLNDKDEENVWKWQDETSLDFANDTSGGKYPWDNSPDPEPNNYGDNENCVLLSSQNDYLFNDRNCNATEKFICNMPNELCSNTLWNYLGDFTLNINNVCGMISDSDTHSIINNKMWMYYDTVWVIEYVYSIHNIHDNTGYGESGILIYHFDNICSYYWIGLAINNNDTTHIFIYKYIDNVKHEIYYSSQLFTYQYDRYYMLSIKLTYSDVINWEISINQHNIVHTDNTSIAYIDHTQFIALKNVDSNITAKSLFISDTPFCNC